MSVFKNPGAEGKVGGATAGIRTALRREFSHSFYKWLGSSETRSRVWEPLWYGALGALNISIAVGVFSMPLTSSEPAERARILQAAPPELLSHWTSEHSGLLFGNTHLLERECELINYQCTDSPQHLDFGTWMGSPYTTAGSGVLGASLFSTAIIMVRRRREGPQNVGVPTPSTSAVPDKV